nr:unnamed protein product [Callosobruchus analis]
MPRLKDYDKSNLDRAVQDVINEVRESYRSAEKNWIIDTESKGFPKMANDLKSSVQKFLNDHPRSDPFKNNRPGDGWVQDFLKRHREISEKTGESVSSASTYVAEKDFRQWFSEVGNYIKESGLEDAIADRSRVYNADDTKFGINPSTGNVFAKRGAKNVYKIDKNAAKENITIILPTTSFIEFNGSCRSLNYTVFGGTERT